MTGTDAHPWGAFSPCRFPARRTRARGRADASAPRGGSRSVRQAIAAAFEWEDDFEVVGEAGSLAQARQMLEHVDVTVVDLALPTATAATSSPSYARKPGSTGTGADREPRPREVARAVESGAAAAINKTAALEELLSAVRRLRAGETLLPLQEVVELLRFAPRERERQYRGARGAASVTAQEREVLQALADGLDSRQTADRLEITIRTERNHVASVLTKRGAHSRLQAVVFALRHGIVEIH